MNRAPNIYMAEQQLLARCRDAGVSVSASQPLPDGDTHLVCTTGAGADERRLRFQDHIIKGTRFGGCRSTPAEAPGKSQAPETRQPL